MFFWTKKFLLLLMAASLIGGCASGARDLPQDYSSIDAKNRLRVEDFDTAALKLTCSQIDEELNILDSEYASKVHDIEEKHIQNQVGVGLVGIFFLPVVLATDSNAEATEKIENINRAKDQLYKLRAFKECPSDLKK